MQNTKPAGRSARKGVRPVRNQHTIRQNTC
jgi:hypothetical protein